MPTPRLTPITAALLAVALLTSCSADSDDGPMLPTSDLADAFWSDADAADALPVAELRASAEDGAEVAVVGRVKDFVDGQAVFTLVDAAVDSCRELEGDACKTPWDYCCTDPTLLADNTVTIEARGDDGRPVRHGVHGFHGIDHLDEVVVRGAVARDEHGNVSVAMSSVHRR